MSSSLSTRPRLGVSTCLRSLSAALASAVLFFSSTELAKAGPLEDLQDQLASVNQAISDCGVQIDGLIGQMMANSSAQDVNNAFVADNQSNLEALQQQIADSSAQASSTGQYQNDLEASKAPISAAIQSLEAELISIATEIATGLADLANAQAELNNPTTEDLQPLLDHIADLENSLDALATAGSQIGEGIANAQSAIASIDQDISICNEMIAEYNNAASQAQQDASALTQAMADASQSSADLAWLNEEINFEIQVQNGLRSSYEQEAAAIQAQIDSLPPQ